MNKFKLLMEGEILNQDIAAFEKSFCDELLPSVQAGELADDMAKIISVKLKISQDDGKTWRLHKNPESPA